MGRDASSQFFAQWRFERLDILRTACFSTELNTWAQLGRKTGPMRLGRQLIPRGAGRLPFLWRITEHVVSFVQFAPFDFHRSFPSTKPRRACAIRGTAVRVLNDAKLIYEETPPLSVCRIRS